MPTKKLKSGSHEIESLGFYNASQIWAYEATYNCAQPKNSGNMFFFMFSTKYDTYTSVSFSQLMLKILESYLSTCLIILNLASFEAKFEGNP